MKSRKEKKSRHHDRGEGDKFDDFNENRTEHKSSHRNKSSHHDDMKSKRSKRSRKHHKDNKDEKEEVDDFGVVRNRSHHKKDKRDRDDGDMNDMKSKRSKRDKKSKYDENKSSRSRKSKRPNREDKGNFLNPGKSDNVKDLKKSDGEFFDELSGVVDKEEDKSIRIMNASMGKFLLFFNF